MHRLEPPIEVTRIPGLHISPHGVHVLLGHRPILDTRRAMSEENVEIVRRVYDGWARGDFSAGEYFDPEIDFELVDWPAPARSRGVDEMWHTWQTTLSAWDD